MVIRRGGRSDVRFLRDMLHHAYYWRERNPGDGPGPAARYVKGWGRPGDTALIAVDDAFPVAAAWYRLFRRDQPGYGFVDEETPELAIAVGEAADAGGEEEGPVATIDVDDVKAERERLAEAGVEVGTVLELHGTMRLLDVFDADGNRLQLAQELS